MSFLATVWRVWMRAPQVSAGLARMLVSLGPDSPAKVRPPSKAALRVVAHDRFEDLGVRPARLVPLPYGAVCPMQ